MPTQWSAFDNLFQSLTGNLPFPWQAKLFNELLEKQFRRTCDVPTGLGKTSVVAVWLIALVHHAQKGELAGFPRRLVYVVNRRTVVDQATREVELLREALVAKAELKPVADTLRGLCVQPAGAPLAISTLRGQFADNAEWRNDPARPAVIVGTVDMVGSRMLFAGYGCGFKSRPLHSGFLGQDVVLIHDEAHLEPAFQELIGAIACEQKRCGEFGAFRVMELTATSRTEQASEALIFTKADQRDKLVKKRFEAKKAIVFHAVDEETGMPDRVAKLALEHSDSGQAILVFLRRVDHVEKVRQTLEKTKQQVQLLTGTLRGLERDELAKKDPIFARFTPKPQVEPTQGTVYLVCTAAGEVGVDISADHMVCDLTPFDSMAQRFGRVNRYGGGNARIDIFYPVDILNEKNNELPPFDQAVKLTFSLLQKLPLCEGERYDASPAALRGLPADDRQAAFTPSPVIRPVGDILFDAWALTSVREKLPGRPPVADWLHGVAEWQPPETYVAWREEVEVLKEGLLERYKPEDLLEDYPLKPHELLRDQTKRVFKNLETLAKRCPKESAWLIDPDGRVRSLLLPLLVEKDKQEKPLVDLKDCTVLLPPRAGGLKGGMLSGGEAFEERIRDRYDISGEWRGEDGSVRRRRVRDDDTVPDDMRLVRTIDVLSATDSAQGEDVEPPHRYWRWYVRPYSADDDGSRTARVAQELAPHLQSVEHFACLLVTKLGLSDTEASAVKLAARWHDLGKNRAVWQRSIGNRNYRQQVLAKSGPGMRPIEVTQYRHEFGSIIDVAALPRFQDLDPEMQDLVLHLIAAHHGRARPHFPSDEAFDPECTEDEITEVAREVPRRFARLQRKYGRWGLAYLESLVRAADAIASQALGSEAVSQTAHLTQETAR